MVMNFKRVMVEQERCLPSGHTEHGGKGSDPSRRWRDELQSIASGCWERPSAGKAQKDNQEHLREGHQ